jgi:hypothetical protein
MNFSTNDFEFNKEKKALWSDLGTLGLPKYPMKFSVTSEHTGAVVEFVYDHDEAELNEGWDGEMALYRPVVDTPNCEYVTISAPYC